MRLNSLNYLFVTLALLSSIGFLRPITAQEMTFGIDGEIWQQLGNTQLGRLQKLVALRGVYDGLLFGEAQDLDAYPRGTSWDTLIDGLDQFYSIAINRRVLVVWALRVLHLEMAGRPEAESERLVRYFRCRANLIGEPLTTAERERRIQLCENL